MLRSVIAAVISCSVLAQDDAVTEDDYSELGVQSLLQTIFEVGHAADVQEVTRAAVRLVGRSYYSSDPTASAEFVKKYIQGKDLETDVAMTVPGSHRANVGFNNWKLLFAKASNSKEADAWAEHIQKLWAAGVSSRSWEHFGDFHDGIYMSTLRIQQLLDDHVGAWFYGTIYPLTRLMVPHTAWTLECKDDVWRGGDIGMRLRTKDGTLAHVKYVNEPGSFGTWYAENKSVSISEFPEFAAKTWALDEPCRNVADHEDAPNSEKLFWKITYAVPNASIARDFATTVLGAVERSCAFPYPPKRECTTGSIWMYLGVHELFQIHLVESAVPDDHERVLNYHAAYAKKAAGLATGCLHPLLYNSLVLEVDSLDTMVTKLQGYKVPHLITRTEAGRFALTFAFPGNEAIVIQVHGDTLTTAVPLDPQELRVDC